MNDRFGYVPRTKSSSLRSVASRAARTSSAIQTLRARFLIQSNSEIKTTFGTRILVCLMPDHLHALISFPYERPMKQIMSDWKRFLATKLKIEWQRDFFDHRLRKEESYREKADYIRANPVRADLVTASEDWPYFWQADPQEQNAIREGRALRRGAPGGRALPLLCNRAAACCVPA